MIPLYTTLLRAQLSTRGKIIFRALRNVRYSATQCNMWDFKDSVAMGDVRYTGRTMEGRSTALNAHDGCSK